MCKCCTQHKHQPDYKLRKGAAYAGGRCGREEGAGGKREALGSGVGEGSAWFGMYSGQSLCCQGALFEVPRLSDSESMLALLYRPNAKAELVLTLLMLPAHR